MELLNIRVSFVAGAIVAIVAAGVITAATTSDEGRVLAVAGRSNATPSIAADGRVVFVAWSASAQGGATDIYVAKSQDAGRTFAAPVRVNDAAAQASVSGEQPPRIALVSHATGEPSVVAVWTAKGASGTRIVTARSDDGGRTFGRTRTVPGTDAPGNRGWEAITTSRNGKILGVWLDHREMASGGSAAMTHEAHVHMPAADGAAKAQLSKLYFGDVDAGGARVVTGGVCYCCKTSVATGADGSLYAVWRHVYPGNIRDIAFTSSRDEGRSFAAPIRVSEDKWALDGCPENGPALAVSGRDVHVVWPTLIKSAGALEPGLALFHAATSDGRSFTPRQPLPVEGVPRHPQIAATANGTLFAVWDEAMSGRRRVVLVRGAAVAGKSLRFAREPIGNGPMDEYPVVAATSDAAVVAWVSRTGDRSVIRVVTTAP
jgi:hypothetical protein